MPALAGTVTPGPSPEAVSQLFVVAPADATATPTPFQPVGPTITPTPTETPTPTPTAVPQEEVVENMPTPIRIEQQAPEGTVNFVVMGNDFRPGGGFRTDVMMLVSVNGGKGTVSVISFPRDLYVTIPGWTTQRINTAFPHGGFALLADTFQYNFGVRPSFYVMTNFQGFIGIINSLGGVKVNVGSFLSDSCDLPQAKAGRCTVYPGEMIMDGDTALWYVRSRHSSNDFDRMRRAQEVLYGVFLHLMSLDAMTKLPDLYSDYKSSIETNVGLDDIMPLLPVAAQVLNDSGRISRYTIGPGQVYNYITEGGAMVLLPNYAAIQQTLAEAIFNR